MSQPPEYTPQHSFVSDSATLANFPGQALDVEFQSVKATTDGIEANLALIQRDDGAIANNSIGYDQLSVALQTAGLQPATPWTTGTVYATGTNATQNSNLYRCLVAHTSGTFATDLAGGKWQLVSALASGAPGPTGATGPANTLAIGTVTNGSAAATITGSAPNQTLNLVLPTGATGAAGAGYGGTSTTSLLIANSTTKTFSTQGALAYQVGDYVRAKSAANSANYMEGAVSSYSGSSLSIAVTAIGGSGTFADWNFSLAGSPGGVSTVNGASGNVALYLAPQGRITLSTGVAVMTSTVSGATSVLYTPSNGNLIPIFNGTNWLPTAFTELSQLTTDTTKSPAACTTNSNYDIFVWNDSGTIRATRGPAWSSNTVRGTGAGTSELDFTTAFPTNKNAITNGPAANRGTWVGSIRTNGSSTVDYNVGGGASGGFAGSLGVWNMYNRNLTTGQSVDGGVSYPLTSNTIRQARASAGNQVSVLVGLAVDTLCVSYQTRIDTAAVSGAFAQIGIGEDTTTTFTSPRIFIKTVAAVLFLGSPYTTIVKTPLLGYHTYAALEASDGTNANSFNGDANATLTLTVWN